jgi:hypothetical protein
VGNEKRSREMSPPHTHGTHTFASMMAPIDLHNLVLLTDDLYFFFKTKKVVYIWR